MASQAPSAPIDPAPYTMCTHCSLERFPRPLPPDAAPAKEADGSDWNEYYWGSYQPEERNTIRRPLPHSITDRIPLELYEHIIHFLRADQGISKAKNCALVCRAWYYPSQMALYYGPEIYKKTHFDAVVRRQPSSPSLAIRRLSMQLFACESMRSRCYFKALPMVSSDRLARGLQCLHLFGFEVPYSRNITMFMSRFSKISHLTLTSFKLYSFEDLRRIICALPSLLELDLIHGATVSESIAPYNGPRFIPTNYPRLRRLDILRPGDTIIVPFSQWVASTDACNTCTELSIYTGKYLDEITWIIPILRKLGSTLASLEWEFMVRDEPFNLDQLMEPLAHCIHLSILKITTQFSESKSWLDFVTTFHTFLLHIPSSRIQKLHFKFFFHHEKSCIKLLPTDSVLGMISLEPIHNTTRNVRFDSLLDVTISLSSFSPHKGYHAMKDIALTDEELAHQLCLVLSPWDKRGILTFTNTNDQPLRADPEECDQIKDINPQNIRSNTHGASGVGDMTSHVVHVECTGHAEEHEARKGFGE